MEWVLKHPDAEAEMLGLLPAFFDEADPRPAKQQLDENYAHGGGWSPFQGFQLTERGLQYPDDPPMLLIAEAKLRDETIRLYEGSWLVILQPDGSWETSRVD